MRMGNGKVNPNPCDIDDIRAQFPQITETLEDLQEAVAGGAVDTHKVKVSGADTTEDYLAASMTTLATRDTDADALIAAEIGSPAGNETLTCFLDASAVTGFSGSGNYSFNIVDGVVQWYDTTNYGGSGSDDKTVKVSAADTTGEYLAATTNDIAVYASGADIVVAAAIVSPGGNEKLQYFVDVSAISGYANPGQLFWVLDDNVSKLATVEYIVTNFLVDNVDFTTLIEEITEAYLDEGDYPDKFRRVRGVVSADVLATDDTFTMTGLSAYANGVEPASPLTVQNIWDNAYTAGDIGVADYRASTDTWEAQRKSLDGEAGSSNTYVCKITTLIAAGSEVGAETGSGAIYEIDEGGGTTSVGSRTVHNFYPFSCPAGIYMASKTFQDFEEPENDEFTIVGLDLPAVLSGLTGFAASTSLYTTGTSPSNIQWGGADCDEEE